MASISWVGGAVATAQVQSYAFGGTWETDDIVRLTIGQKTVNVTAASATTNTVIDNVVTAWNALSSSVYPEFAEITASRSSSNLILTMDTAGKPFTCTITPLESDGSAAGAQTIGGAGVATTGTASTASSGPEDVSTAANWSAGAIPVNGDTVTIDREGARLKYGLNQSTIALAALNILAKDVEIGLPKKNADSTSYPEYRDDYWKISATSVYVSTASNRVKLNLGSTQTTYEQDASGSGTEQYVPAVLLRGTHASNVWTINKGVAGLAFFAGETASLYTLNVGKGVTVTLGSGCTNYTLNNYGGKLYVNSAIATALNHPSSSGGTTTIEGSGAVAQVTAQSGQVNYNTTGELQGDTVLGGSAVLNFDDDQRVKQVLNPIQIYSPSAKVSDKNGVIDGGYTLQFYNCTGTIQCAPNSEVTVSGM